MLLCFEVVDYRNNMKNLPAQLQQIREQIAQAERRYGREAGCVKLLAVSKTRDHAEILSLLGQGQRDFGENYVQEALGKIDRLAKYRPIWHFIGPIQSNKTRQIARHFHWAHSIERARIARRLNDARPANLPPLNICIQVNIDAAPSKSGVAADAVSELAEQMQSLGRINLRGLMAFPAPCDDVAVQRATFAKLRQIYDRLLQAGYELDTLSMGTTHDMQAAIAEGATLVRIGAALFGQRDDKR